MKKFMSAVLITSLASQASFAADYSIEEICDRMNDSKGTAITAVGGVVLSFGLVKQFKAIKELYKELMERDSKYALGPVIKAPTDFDMSAAFYEREAAIVDKLLASGDADLGKVFDKKHINEAFNALEKKELGVQSITGLLDKYKPHAEQKQFLFEINKVRDKISEFQMGSENETITLREALMRRKEVYSKVLEDISLLRQQNIALEFHGEKEKIFKFKPSAETQTAVKQESKLATDRKKAFELVYRDLKAQSKDFFPPINSELPADAKLRAEASRKFILQKAAQEIMNTGIKPEGYVLQKLLAPVGEANSINRLSDPRYRWAINEMKETFDKKLKYKEVKKVPNYDKYGASGGEKMKSINKSFSKANGLMVLGLGLLIGGMEYSKRESLGGDFSLDLGMAHDTFDVLRQGYDQCVGMLKNNSMLYMAAQQAYKIKDGASPQISEETIKQDVPKKSVPATSKPTTQKVH